MMSCSSPTSGWPALDNLADTSAISKNCDTSHDWCIPSSHRTRDLHSALGWEERHESIHLSPKFRVDDSNNCESDTDNSAGDILTTQ
jgi:hypothetical protein